MTNYFHKVKSLADTLAATVHSLREEEIIIQMLTGLESDYDPLVTSLTMRTESIGLTNLYAHMLSFELRQEQNNSAYQVSGSSANVASCGGQENCGSLGGHNGRGGRDRGRGDRQQQSYQRNNIENKDSCQLCGRFNHMALDCYHRFDHMYQSEKSRARVALPNYFVDPLWYTDT